jgi:putative peptide zinc metalloprotease protein
MNVLAVSTTSGNIRSRPDLQFVPQGTGDARYWVVEDPVSLKYFRLQDEERLILQLLDGRTALDQVKEQFEQRFAPLRLSVWQLHAFLFHLHELGLVVADAPRQGTVLQERRQKNRTREVLSAITSPLAIRLPGIAAEPIVEWLYPRVRWLFSPACLLACLALVLTAAGLVALNFAAFQSRLPDFWHFFDPRSLVLFAAALVGIKALHELGHALTCRHFGGRCREFGVLLLVFMPTLYCDVSDAWRLRSRWQRILVSSAGMLVELVLASVATLLWWFSEPGLLNSLCLRVMFVCSVGTLLFNLNPLLRCDGYFILSDLVNVPNLWQESRAQWQRALWSWLGVPLPPDPTYSPAQRGWLMVYAAASTLYCWLLIGAILWFCFRVLEPHGLGLLAIVLAVLVLIPLAVQPAVRTLRRLAVPGGLRGVRRGRATLSLFVVFAALALAAFVPLPHRVAAPMWLEAKDAHSVYVPVPGILQDIVQPGTVVAAGDELATLASPEIALQVARSAAEVRRYELQLQHLRLLQNDDPTAQPLIPAAEKALTDARQQLAQWQRDQERLTLRAPAAGTVLPPPATAASANDKIRLATWQGTPLDPPNRGCYLESGSLVCLVGDPQRLEALLIVEQTDIVFARIGQSVRLRVGQSPVKVIGGKIIEIAQADAGELPAGLAKALHLPQTGAGGARHETAATYYQVRVELEPNNAPLLVGMHGEARILADWQPLAAHVWRYLQRTFALG